MKKLPPISNKPMNTFFTNDNANIKIFQIDDNNKVKNKLLPKLKIKEEGKSKLISNKDKDENKELFFQPKKKNLPRVLTKKIIITDIPEIPNKKSKNLNEKFR